MPHGPVRTARAARLLRCGPRCPPVAARRNASMPPEHEPVVATRRIQAVRAYLDALQERICSALEAADGAARFVEDAWTRGEGDAGGRPAAGSLTGLGRTRVLKDGAVFEQAGVNFSQVSGTRLPPAASAHRPELAGAPWSALGVSLVVHPRNPYVPTTHMNVRYFEARPQHPGHDR